MNKIEFRQLLVDIYDKYDSKMNRNPDEPFDQYYDTLYELLSEAVQDCGGEPFSYESLIVRKLTHDLLEKLWKKTTIEYKISKTIVVHKSNRYFPEFDDEKTKNNTDVAGV